ncbi:MAG: hypothetical protein DMG16_01205 [Acidobacteria bacterium]|nr:MAG: hypothetical protein DMG16_01205 [Acidobacteriota bacterium]
MATLARPSINTSHITESLKVAHDMLRRDRDPELASKIMVLEGYLELRRMNPDRSYDDRIRKAFNDLMSRLQVQTAEMHRKPLRPMSEAQSLDMSALEMARALLRNGQTLEALPLIDQAMRQYPQAASELKAEADTQIQAIDQIINRALADDSSSSAFALAKRAGRAIAQIAATLNRKSA